MALLLPSGDGDLWIVYLLSLSALAEASRALPSPWPEVIFFKSEFCRAPVKTDPSRVEWPA